MATAASTQIQPLADRVVVKALEETEQMRGGLYIPDTAKEKPQQGEIIDSGPRLPFDGDPARSAGDSRYQPLVGASGPKRSNPRPTKATRSAPSWPRATLDSAR